MSNITGHKRKLPSEHEILPEVESSTKHQVLSKPGSDFNKADINFVDQASTSATSVSNISTSKMVKSGSLITAPKCQLYHQETLRKKKPLDIVESSVLNMSAAVTSHLKSQKTEDEEDIFGSLVSSELKKLYEPEKSEMKRKLLTVLYRL